MISGSKFSGMEWRYLDLFLIKLNKLRIIINIVFDELIILKWKLLFWSWHLCHNVSQSHVLISLCLDRIPKSIINLMLMSRSKEFITTSIKLMISKTWRWCSSIISSLTTVYNLSYSSFERKGLCKTGPLCLV
jgi:hypothetical protein